MSLGAILLPVGAYLVGSFPSGYVMARLLRGIDIRRYGSGGVGGSNVWRAVSGRATIPVLLMDVAKGLLPVLVAQLMGLDILWQVAAGLASIIGHNWSLFLGFQGGRGIATSGGVVVILAPWELTAAIAVAGVGLLLLRSVPLAMAIAVMVLPLASWLRGEPSALTWGCLGILVLMMLRRTTANGVASPLSHQGRQVIINRLLFDRDIRDRKAWVYRKPSEPTSQEEEQ